MRVAVYLPAEHPEHGGGHDNGFAYRLGRIEPGVHNAPIGHAEIPFEKFVQGLLADAQAEYPDAVVALERLVDNGDGTGQWIAASDFDPEQHTPLGAGNQKQTELTVRSDQNEA